MTVEAVRCSQRTCHHHHPVNKQSHTVFELCKNRTRFINCVKMRQISIAGLVLLSFFSLQVQQTQAVDNVTSEVVVRVFGGPLVAQLLAQETGHYYKGPVMGFENTYIFIPLPWNDVILNNQKRDGQPVKRIVDDQRVLWAEPQQAKQRQKRDVHFPNIKNDLVDFDLFKTVLEVEKERQKQQRRDHSNRNRNNRYKRPLPVPKSDHTFNDELWPHQWYLHDTRTRSDLPKLDLNVIPLYRAGVTGRGVRVSILDDGIEYTHADLRANYDPAISYDCNEDDEDPMPRYDEQRSNSHGTRCAGEVAMLSNNGKCGVGVAFNARIGGVKLLDGLVTDRLEGMALSYRQDLVDIYSASWGPNDDGKTVDGPGILAREALENGVRNGRGGRGVVYVWASGNGGSRDDNCNCDGYLASPYTVSIGSASEKGEFPWYGEACASTLAVTYSSGAYKDQMIATTDLRNQCTIKHTGTSASAPLAAGIIALALEVNPNLTWRDIQHLIVWTSELAPLANNVGWQQNAAGFWFNTRFGFGLMNALGLVTLAANWTNVPPKFTCIATSPPRNHNITVKYGHPATVYVKSSGCAGSATAVNYLEHVEVQVNINYNVRGALDVLLISPSGTKVELLQPRRLDSSPQGFQNWKFMSVMNWGEKPHGIWQIIVSDKVGPIGNFGNVGSITLYMHGTKSMPERMRKGPRNYDHDYNRLSNRVGAVKTYGDVDLTDGGSEMSNNDFEVNFNDVTVFDD